MKHNHAIPGIRRDTTVPQSIPANPSPGIPWPLVIIRLAVAIAALAPWVAAWILAR